MNKAKPTYEQLQADNSRWAQVCWAQNRRIDELETQLAKVTAERDEARAEMENHKKGFAVNARQGGDKVTYSDKFKAARKAAGLTQEACAARLGVPARTLENWEAGSRTPPDYVQRLVLAEMARLAAAK